MDEGDLTFKCGELLSELIQVRKERDAAIARAASAEERTERLQHERDELMSSFMKEARKRSDAEDRYLPLLTERDELRAEVGELTAERDVAQAEAAKLRSDVERLTPVQAPEPSEEDKADFSAWVKVLVTIDPIVDYLRACHVQELPEELGHLVMAWRSKPPTEAAQTCLQCEADASVCTCVDGPRTVSR